MTYVKEVNITTYAPNRFAKVQGKPCVDVAFIRSDGSFREYEDATSDQLSRLLKALKNSTNPNNTTVYIYDDMMISAIQV